MTSQRTKVNLGAMKYKHGGFWSFVEVAVMIYCYSHIWSIFVILVRVLSYFI